ncbi:hypothetical protein EDB83DRAFT_361652 [Lactarius deliciosus]|nr:hypothetical protein EDB83DRAFT_361652 [Lactarius deliciosus]
MDPSHLRQAIDAEIKSLEESIRTLRRRRNTLVPVSSLPSEVITTIFSFLRVRVTLLDFKLDEKPDDLAWLRVAHVCHQWRDIALNHPIFWSHVDFTAVSSVGAAEILARAKMVPLHLEARVPVAHWDDARFSAFKKELQNHVSHISHLGISAVPFHLHRILKGLTSPAPTLESLSLSGEGQNSTLGGRTFIPGTLFNGSAPKLSCLELWNCDISWKSPLLGGLRHLEIRAPSERPSRSVWLDVLDQMPQLKTLVLHWASPTAPPSVSFPPNVERTATLPSLTFFDISSPARDCGLALAHLILPALTSLCLIATSCCRDGSDLQEILPYFARHAHGPQDAQPLQSMVVHSDTMCVDILAWTSLDIDVESHKQFDAFLGTTHSARVAFSVTNDNWPLGTEVEVLNAAMAALPLDGLVTLTVQTARCPSTSSSGSATRRSGLCFGACV